MRTGHTATRNTGSNRAMRAAACRCLIAAAVLAMGACSSHRMSVEDATAAPLSGWEDDMRNASLAGNYMFSGQPTAEGVGRYAADGGSMVIDLRTHEGRDMADFDEAEAVRAHGMEYVNIPFSSSTFSRDDVTAFAKALDSADGPVLVHCGSSNRVGGMWAAYLAREQGWDTEAAIEAGRAAGMSSESVEAAARRVIDE